MKKKRFLPLYFKWMERGVVDGGNGLCFSPASEGTELIFFHPTVQDRFRLAKEGMSDVYWASGLPLSADLSDRTSLFTPLRQTILLFMAAMNDEL